MLKGSHLYDNIDKLIEKMLGLSEVVLKYLTGQMAALEAEFREQIRNKDPAWK